MGIPLISSDHCLNQVSSIPSWHFLEFGCPNCNSVYRVSQLAPRRMKRESFPVMFTCRRSLINDYVSDVSRH